MNKLGKGANVALETILKKFERYYNVTTKGIEPPFAAEAAFKSHSEQYFLVKAAKVADIDSNEFVFFYSNDNVPPQTQDDITQIADAAWERGLSRITPYYGHRNTDITLIVLSEKIGEDAFKKIKKLNHYKSYKFGLYGWSSFRTLAYESSTGRLATNWRGRGLKKLIGSI